MRFPGPILLDVDSAAYSPMELDSASTANILVPFTSQALLIFFSSLLFVVDNINLPPGPVFFCPVPFLVPFLLLQTKVGVGGPA